MKRVYSGIHENFDKMTFACKFIDFFVHDLLDYTILNKDSRNFIKICRSFDVKKAMREILDILDDKIKLK